MRLSDAEKRDRFLAVVADLQRAASVGITTQLGYRHWPEARFSDRVAWLSIESSDLVGVDGVKVTWADIVGSGERRGSHRSCSRAEAWDVVAAFVSDGFTTHDEYRRWTISRGLVSAPSVSTIEARFGMSWSAVVALVGALTKWTVGC